MINEDFRSCVIYGGYIVTRTSLYNFKILQKSIPQYCSLFWMTDPGLAIENGVDKEELKNINFIYFKTSDIFKYGTYNINYVLERTYDKLKKEGYDYFYYIEYDLYYTGNYKILFQELDGNSEADYIGMFFKMIPFGYNRWNLLDIYLDKLKNVDLDMRWCIKSYSPFFRISAKALRFICKYKYSDIKKFNYNLVYPTLLYNYNFKLEDIGISTEYKRDIKFQSKYTLAFSPTCNKNMKFLSGKQIKQYVNNTNYTNLFFHSMKVNMDLYK